MSTVSPLAAVRVIGAGAALTCSAALVALYATTIPADVSQAAEHAPKPLTVTSEAARPTTFAPIFPTPTEDQPQPWSEDDGPLFATTPPAADVEDRPAPTTRAPSRSVPAPVAGGNSGPAGVAPGEPAPATAAPTRTSAPVPPPPADVPRDVPTERPPDPEPTPQPTVTHPVTVLVNNARAEAGCPPVTDDPDMTAYAQQWAQQQAADQLMRHSGGPYAENVAAGPYPTGAEVMAAWMGSSGHRGNIETCEFTRHGIGSAVGDDGLTYWTQVFA